MGMWDGLHCATKLIIFNDCEIFQVIFTIDDTAYAST